MANEQLYTRFRSGDQHAFGELYRRCNEDIEAWAVINELQLDDAADIVHECWLEILASLPEVRGSFLAFFRRRRKWRLYDFLRKHSGTEPWHAESNYFDHETLKGRARVKHAENAVEARGTLRGGESNAGRRARYVQLAALRTAIQRLPPDQQQVIQDYDLGDLTLEQAARKIGITVMPLRTRRGLALHNLRETYKKIVDAAEFESEIESLLAGWGDIRPTLHWVPDDKDERCNCWECMKRFTYSVIPRPHFLQSPSAGVPERPPVKRCPLPVITPKLATCW
jgi:RNA polymerase sigma factor (sigma-70 family)